MGSVAKVGDMVSYTPGSGANGYPKTVRQGQLYEVIYVDPNDGPEWPDGCTGIPFIAIRDDNGTPFWGFFYRFTKGEPKQ